MSEVHSNKSGRDQFSTRLKCSRCDADGHALWEENSEVSNAGPMGALIRISDNFILRMPRGPQGQPEIACKTCGTTHPD